MCLAAFLGVTPLPFSSVSPMSILGLRKRCLLRMTSTVLWCHPWGPESPARLPYIAATKTLLWRWASGDFSSKAGPPAPRLKMKREICVSPSVCLPSLRNGERIFWLIFYQGMHGLTNKMVLMLYQSYILPQYNGQMYGCSLKFFLDSGFWILLFHFLFRSSLLNFPSF